MVLNTDTASATAKKCNGIWVPTERVNMVTHPSKQRFQFTKTVILKHVYEQKLTCVHTLKPLSDPKARSFQGLDYLQCSKNLIKVKDQK